MVIAILAGLILSTLTVCIHAIGTTWWVGRLRQYAIRTNDQSHFRVRLRVLIHTVLLLLTLHLTEVVSWAAAYWMLPGIPQLNSVEEAIYFSTVTFTTLGYGDIVLNSPWRMLGAIQAALGMLIFGWSTAMLFSVVQRTMRDESSQGS
ncbi:potassium channel family protein [Roseiconus lacunae]|uniref:Potassium channel family protein n=1 Tax=Roseiconus lacunae TaxID=2605694 RepID=A0ABT7PFF7_9BACT|nr:potassium channel family protein [Roseiconus lacunae]MCD0462776.1 potassium channel family protein [Roseiconus lacunae]MDM4015217.1 potassium channel family protein [Roseiconus lacunae]WRQ50106.1 potassium channel family protein [Stieleria sp. HD01]